jgi:hypothetical protein
VDTLTLNQPSGRPSTASKTELNAKGKTFVLSSGDRESCGEELVYKAIHRPDQRLLMAFKLSMVPYEFSRAEERSSAELSFPQRLERLRIWEAARPSLPRVVNRELPGAASENA